MRIAPFALLLALAGHQSVSAAPSVRPRFIQDDYARALEEARTRKVPIFIDAWAPW
jgi:endonuclease YncB( thermonuclease family)